MNVKEMHYDFKKKLNKIDSQQYRNLLIPEIDWVLNEAQNIFIRQIAEPRQYSYMGFEKSQRNIDEIRVLVTTQSLTVNDNIISLPDDYMYYVKGRVIMNREKCGDREGVLYIKQHDDEFENSPFDKSSYEWFTVNGVFNNNGILLYDDSTFKNKLVNLTYIRKPKYIHNAEDFNQHQYELPGHKILTGHQDCELPENTHRQIVDLAVKISSGELQLQNYQIHSNKSQETMQL